MHVILGDFFYVFFFLSPRRAEVKKPLSLSQRGDKNRNYRSIHRSEGNRQMQKERGLSDADTDGKKRSRMETKRMELEKTEIKEQSSCVFPLFRLDSEFYWIPSVFILF